MWPSAVVEHCWPRVRPAVAMRGDGLLRVQIFCSAQLLLVLEFADMPPVPAQAPTALPTRGQSIRAGHTSRETAGELFSDTGRYCAVTTDERLLQKCEQLRTLTFSRQTMAKTPSILVLWNGC
jgi:hypothetical protein